MRPRGAASSGVLLLLFACSAGSDESRAVDDATLTVDPATSCACPLDAICAGGSCVARPEVKAGELFARFELLQQASPMASSLVTRKLGRTSASFHVGEALPADTRPKVVTPEGEDCFYEVGTKYPWSYGGQSWPSTPGLHAGGKIAFRVTGAPGTIELEGVDLQTEWGYYHKHVPPRLTEGSVTYPDFFDPAYLPAGGDVTISLGGGDDVGTATIAGELPSAFAITAPAVDSPGAIVDWGVALPVRWSPPQPSAFMEISFAMWSGHDLALLTCKVKDDGEAVIPSAAMQHLAGDVGVELRRTTERYTRIEQRAGGSTILHAFVLGHHARVGRLRVQP